MNPEAVAAQLKEHFERVELTPKEDGWHVRTVARCLKTNGSGGVIQPLPDLELEGLLRKAA